MTGFGSFPLGYEVEVDYALEMGSPVRKGQRNKVGLKTLPDVAVSRRAL